MQLKNHYAALDGMRGLAAVSVLLFHLGHWLGIAGLAANARLSVDLFFCLSGYVVPLAYRTKLGSAMDFRWFVRVRVVRLWPMIVAGTLISAGYCAVRRLALHDAGIGLPRLAFDGVLGLLCLPDFAAPRAIGGPNVFPLNGPQYTLFLELAVNLAWAATPRLRGPAVSIVIVLVSFALMAVFGPGSDLPGTFLPGFARVFGLFYCGVLVEHALRNADRPMAGAAIRLCRPPVTLPVLVLTAGLFLWPTPLPAAVNWTWSLLGAPILVLGGTQIVLPRPVHSVELWLGELSYPLYVLHYLVFVWCNGLFQKLVGHKAPLVECLLIVPLTIVASELVLHVVDTPLRSALGRAARRPTPASAAKAVKC